MQNSALLADFQLVLTKMVAHARLVTSHDSRQVALDFLNEKGYPAHNIPTIVSFLKHVEKAQRSWTLLVRKDPGLLLKRFSRPQPARSQPPTLHLGQLYTLERRSSKSHGPETFDPEKQAF